MKLAILIALGVMLGAIAFLLFVVVPEKAEKTSLVVLSFIAFLAILFLGAIGIYRLAEFWNMENQAKVILGIMAYANILGSLLFGKRIIVSKKQDDEDAF